MRGMIERHPWGGLADPRATPPADVLILGLPYDGAACWRAGASAAPRRLREISATSPAISEIGEPVDPQDLSVVDLGDLAPEAPAGGPTGGDEEARGRYFDRIERTVA